MTPIRMLVTGASGYIGRHVLSLLAKRSDIELHAVSRISRVNVSGTQWHNVDLLDGDAAENLLRSVEATHLIHLAWYVKHGSFWTSSENSRWQHATLKLARAFYKYGGKRMLGAGSCAEYLFGSNSPYVESDDKAFPSTPYGVAKLETYRRLCEIASDHNGSFAWGRVFFSFGPHEDARRLVPSVINSLLADKPALCTSGIQKRDFIYVEDLAHAFIELCLSDLTGAVNIGGGDVLTIRSLVNRIAESMGASKLVSIGALPDREGEPRILIPNLHRLNVELGWHPAYSLDEALLATIDWWKKHSSPVR